MGVIFIMIIISMTVAGCFFGAFLWAVNTGQYEDDETPAIRILFEDKIKSKK